MSQINNYKPEQYLTKKQVLSYTYMWRYTRIQCMGIKLPFKNVMYTTSETTEELMIKWLKYWCNVWWVSSILSDSVTKQGPYARNMHDTVNDLLFDKEYIKSVKYVENNKPVFPTFDNEYKIWKALKFIEREYVEEV